MAQNATVENFNESSVEKGQDPAVPGKKTRNTFRECAKVAYEVEMFFRSDVGQCLFRGGYKPTNALEERLYNQWLKAEEERKKHRDLLMEMFTDPDATLRCPNCKFESSW